MVATLTQAPKMNINVDTPSNPCETDVQHSFSQIPLTALSKDTRRQLSHSLNLKKLLRSEEGYERDWRGIASLSQQKTLCDENALSGADPMAKVLQLWCTNSAQTATFDNLERYLGTIDRWDVCDDIYENLVKDAKGYRDSIEQNAALTQKPSDQWNGADIIDDFGLGSDPSIITKDDVQRAQKGLPPQKYDAFVLFADADINHAVEMMTKLEENPSYNFKLCLKERDLLTGLAFAHVALTQLIEERCKHLIVILTEEFLKSPENKFLVNYTQALQIEHRTRKIIPLIYEDSVRIPRTLKIYTHLKYNSRPGCLFDFWAKLAASIRNVDVVVNESPLTAINIHNIPLQCLHKQQGILRSKESSCPSFTDSIPSITINGTTFNSNDNASEELSSGKMKKSPSLYNGDNRMLMVKGLALRNAHSTSQLNSSIFQETNLHQMADLSASTCSGNMKKKRKWPSKLFKKVFSRSNSRLQEA